MNVWSGHVVPNTSPKFKLKMNRGEQKPWVKGSVCLFIELTLPPFSPPPPSVVEVSKQNNLWPKNYVHPCIWLRSCTSFGITNIWSDQKWTHLILWKSLNSTESIELPPSWLPLLFLVPSKKTKTVGCSLQTPLNIPPHAPAIVSQLPRLGWWDEKEPVGSNRIHTGFKMNTLQVPRLDYSYFTYISGRLMWSTVQYNENLPCSPLFPILLFIVFWLY